MPQIDGGAPNLAAQEAARKAAEEAARKAAEEAARKAAEEAARKAAEAAAKKAAEEAAKAAQDKQQTGGLDRFKDGVKNVADAAHDALPWVAGPLGVLGPVVAFAKKFSEVDQKKSDDFVTANADKFSEAGQAELKKMADDGTLGKVDNNFKNMRDSLDGFLKAGGDPKVAEAIVNQVAQPDTVLQANENTCTAATVQKAMAQDNPGAYVQVVSDLMTKGTTTLPNGQTMALSPENKAFLDAHPEMPIEQRINATFQAAAMDLGNAGDKYSLATDTSHHEETGLSETYTGLSTDQAKTINEALLGCPSVEADGINAYMQKAIADNKKAGGDKTCEDMAMEYVKAQFDAAKQDGAPGVFVTMHAGTEYDGPQGHMQMDEYRVNKYHEMMIKDIDDKGNVTLLDAMGTETHMSKQDFYRNLAQDNAGDRERGGVGELSTGTGQAAPAISGGRRPPAPTTYVATQYH